MKGCPTAGHYLLAVVALLVTLSSVVQTLPADGGKVVEVDESSLVKKDAIKVDCSNKTAQNIELKDVNQEVVIGCDGSHRFSDLTVTVTSTNELSLYLVDLHDFKAGDEFTVWSDNKTIHKLDTSTRAVHLWMPTGLKSVKIQMKKTQTSPAVATIHVKQQCGNTFDEREFNHLLIPSEGKAAGLGNASCAFKITQPALYDFETVTLQNTSSVTFTAGVDPAFSKPFNEPPPHIYIGGLNTEVKFDLDLTDPKQDVAFTMTHLKGQCGKSMLNIASPVNISATGNESTPEVFCAWLLDANNETKVDLTLVSSYLGYATDLVSIIDSGKLNGRTLGQVTNLTTDFGSVTSSGQFVVITLISKNFNDLQQRVELTASPIQFGGHLYESGNFSLGATSDYILSAETSKSVYVSFGALGKLTEGQKIEVYTSTASKASPLITFTKDLGAFDVSSPGSVLRIVAQGFKNVANATFFSIPRNSGCMRTFVGAQESHMKLAGDCPGQAIWLIRPEVKDDEVIFFKVLPNNAKSARIHRFATSEGAINLTETSEPFMFVYSVNDSARVELDKGSENFIMSYTTQGKDQPINVEAGPGSNFTLMSPFYPGLYPRGAVFKYNVSLPGDPKTPVTYLASFSALDLATGDTLAFADKALQFSGSDLPNDILMDKKTFSDVTLETKDPSKFNPKGAFGFRVDLMPTGEAKTFATAEGSGVFNDGNKTICNDLRCVAIIELQMPADKEEGVAVNISFTFPNATNLTEGSLIVWDGESTLRSPLLAPLANFTHGGEFVSRTHRLIVVYEAPEKLHFAYTTHHCEFKHGQPGTSDNGTYTMCLADRSCMPDGWRCNGKSECSDGSDEFYCYNYPPPPPPQMKSSNGWRNAFWICLPIFVLLGVALTKGWPIVAQRLRESRYQQFHDLGDH